ncbi:hypothetical protein BG003_005405 [Podila horticola]|nr:hypothetical protein BG003_005405 [Podila horticola]
MKITFLLVPTLLATFALTQSSAENFSFSIGTYRVRSKTQYDKDTWAWHKWNPKSIEPSAIPPEFIKGLNFYLLDLYQHSKRMQVTMTVHEGDELLRVYGYGVINRNQPLAYFGLEVSDGTAVDAHWRNALAAMPDVIAFRNASRAQPALDTGMTGKVTIKPWQPFANPKLLWSLEGFKEMWTAMRVLGNIMAQNRYSDILHTCPEGHALKVTAMAYSLLPNSLDSKKISADYFTITSIHRLNDLSDRKAWQVRRRKLDKQPHLAWKTVQEPLARIFLQHCTLL